MEDLPREEKRLGQKLQKGGMHNFKTLLMSRALTEFCNFVFVSLLSPEPTVERM